MLNNIWEFVIFILKIDYNLWRDIWKESYLKNADKAVIFYQVGGAE